MWASRFITAVLLSQSITSCEEIKYRDVEEAESIVNLRKWATERGARIHPHLRVLPVPDMGRGVVAIQDIEEGEQLFYLPRSLWLSDDQAQLLLEDVLTPLQHETIERARASEPEGCTPTPWALILTVVLLSKPPSSSSTSASTSSVSSLPPSLSEWQPLVASFPSECVGEVCAKTRHGKQDSDRELWIRGCLDSLHDVVARVAGAIGNQGVFGEVSTEHMHWATSMVTSRLQVITDDNQEPPMFVPFLDCINSHRFDDCCTSTPASPPICESEDDDSTCVDQEPFLTNYTAKRDFKAGQQLFEVYGDLSNLELFLLFGFKSPTVAHDGPSVRMVS